MDSPGFRFRPAHGRANDTANTQDQQDDGSDGGLAASFGTWRVVLPAVSFGNLGQLAVDVLLRRHCQLVGWLVSDCVEPVAVSCGDGVHLPIEVFKHEESKTLIVQRRSLTLPGCQARLAREVLAFAAEFNAREIVCLAGSDMSACKDENLIASMEGCAFFQSTKEKRCSELLEIAKLRQSTAGSGDLRMSGIATYLLGAATKLDTDVTVLFLFCSEGNNMGDGRRLAQALGEAVPTLSALASGDDEPTSWKMGQRDGAVSREIFN